MQGQSNFRIALLSGVSAIAVITSMSVSAQAKDLIRSGIETVTVTAERRKENLQSVPIAISAFSQKQLTDRQIAGGPDLVKEVPNLTFSKTNFTGYNLEIRGIGTQAISVTTDPAVSVALNGIPFIRNHFFEEKFFDLSNVEVLRGPQGTLWGRNANAGVVNIITAKPVGHFEAEGSVAVGNYNSRRLEGMLNLPIVGSKFDIRMAGEWTKRDGYAFNQTTNQPIDGRDLWSGRFSARFRPNSRFEADFVWEHFQESDDRLRSGKQLCMTDPGPTSFTAANGTVVPVPPPRGGAFGLNSSWFSQGCLPNSLYNKNSFEVPNGFSLPFVQGATFEGLINTNLNPYAQTTQSTNLRDIQSAINPTYIAKNDTLEFNAQWHAKPWLTVYSDTGYNRDFLWSSEDYNRFDTTPGIFIPDTGYASRHLIDPVTKMFCDPQLGCSDRLVVQDLATEKSWQFSQEFRAQSDLSGPFNFSVGANYLHYETTEDYYVFSNTFTMLSLRNVGCDVPYQPGVTNNIYCLHNGPSYTPPASNDSIPTESPQYVDPNPIHSLDNEGHNYFLSQNPYTLNSYAAFGEAYYQVRPDLKLTAGLRWTDDQKHFDEIPSELLATGYGYPSTGVVNQEWGRLTGRFVANWTPKLPFTDQTMIYASYAHGYKAGGANPPGPVLLNADTGASTPGYTVNVTFPVHPLTFKPEYIDAFELGTKNEALGDNLVFNADVFYYNYKNYQISQIVDRTSVNLNFNAQVKGAEVQTEWTPLQGLSFSFNGGYEDATLNNHQYAIDLMDRTAGHPGWVVMK
ncbi:MAG: TonB-dependent receptor, partial [Alphaproteobacteria bacterium]|nr:TonB-dependent receptor [Alphaproteobacteria bacterium]